jgi:hypothetical protein
MQDTFADTTIRQPDFIDEVQGTAVWIGEDAAVEVDLLLLDRVAGLAHNAGWHARTDATPEARGLIVARFAPDYVHPVWGHVDLKGSNAEASEAWRLMHDAVGAHCAWLEQ